MTAMRLIWNLPAITRSSSLPAVIHRRPRAAAAAAAACTCSSQPAPLPCGFQPACCPLGDAFAGRRRRVLQRGARFRLDAQVSATSARPSLFRTSPKRCHCERAMCWPLNGPQQIHACHQVANWPWVLGCIQSHVRATRRSCAVTRLAVAGGGECRLTACCRARRGATSSLARWRAQLQGQPQRLWRRCACRFTFLPMCKCCKLHALCAHVDTNPLGVA
jgi:hypothetical protein